VSIPKLLLSTGNLAKTREYLLLLDGVPFQLTTPAEEGMSVDVTEGGDTMDDNAKLKAQAYALQSGLLSLADDSGLEVDALGGEPGVLSARYGKEGFSDEERNEYLLRRLRGIPWEKRSARFKCVIAIAAPSGRMETCVGECHGIIAFEPRGKTGFGYDPIFYLPELGVTVAELALEKKNEISHRGKAARTARRLLENLSDSLSEDKG
jgi:XTP/dITP diphosphohydrolase